MKGVWLLLFLLAMLLGPVRSFAEPVVVTFPERPAPGEIFLLRVTGVSPVGRLEVRLVARSFPLWREAGGSSWAGLVALDRDEVSGSRDLFLVDRSDGTERLTAVHEVQIGTRDYGTQEIFVDEAKVTLSRADQARVDRENAAILAVLAQKSDSKLWAGPFEVPVPGEITGPFGVRRVYNGKPKGYHNGIDISAAKGVPVAAPSAGKVALVGDYFMTGQTVVLDHGLGLHTAYFHMDSATVVEGETVEAGAVVGLVGSTGRSTGPHLHWGVYVSGVRGDPESLLRISRAMAER